MSNADLAPGVRIVEAAPVSQPANLGPTLTGMIGTARRGRVDLAQVVTDWATFVSLYGGYTQDVDLGVFAQEYFRSGGASLRVLRVAPSDAVGASNSTDLLTRAGGSIGVVSAISPGSWGNEVAVKTALKEVRSTDEQKTVDGFGNDLPNVDANGLSEDTVRIPVDDINTLQAGDVVDVFTSNNVYQAVVVVLAVDASSRSVVVNKAGGLDVTGAGFYLRSCSQHRTKTLAVEGISDNTTASLLLDSVAGLTRGSLLTAYLYSHVETAPDLSIAARCNLIVDRIAGQRVYLTAAAQTSTDEDVPATTNAAIRYVVTANTNYADVVAKAAGPAGNKVSLRVVVGAGSNSIEVSGKTITVNSQNYSLAGMKAAIEANDLANALVSVTVTGAGNLADGGALAATRLTGGANLLVASQEFGLEVFVGADLAERHDYLSAVSTSPDFVQARLGGDPDTFTPVSGSQSGLVIVSGMDEAVDSADTEFSAQPRALVSVGLEDGDDGGSLTDADWIGGTDPNTGLHLLTSYEDLKLVTLPGVTSPDVQREAVAMAEASGRVVALLDPPLEAASATALLLHRDNDLGLNTRFGQVASTWAKVRDTRSGALRGALITVPPSPAWAGLVAQGQLEVGPHGSCGGRVPPTWVELTYNASQDDAGLLDSRGVSVFRVVAGQIKCYGDNTLLQIQDPRQFGNVSRMLNALIHDLEADLGTVIFQPGSDAAFGRIEAILNRRLLQYHRAGALYPQSSPKQAFRVACNASTTTPEDVASGRFYAEVVLSPATLVKQIVLRLSVSAGGVRLVN